MISIRKFREAEYLSWLPKDIVVHIAKVLWENYRNDESWDLESKKEEQEEKN